mmetsp:Transcript_8701/g.19739  ORF Transcript_8701/g.19739 Transcript_8701/m.19739 type:complete len:211 (-) Transcript_8701:69-701(-)
MLAMEGCECNKILEMVRQDVLQDAEEVGSEDLERFRTTARKTMTLDIGDNLRVINIHVKEMNTEAGTQFLADYMRCLCHPDKINFVLADTNIPNPSKVNTFTARASSLGLHVIPCRSTTTRKKRTELHGQMYDERKCFKVVEARKDFCLCWAGGERRERVEAALRKWEVKVFPELGEEAELLLPNAHWPTDHAMLAVELEILPQLLSPSS